MGQIRQGKLGKLVQYNAAWIPEGAIIPDKNGREQVTIWTGPIRQMLAAQN